MSMKSFWGKVAAITGAGSGIGRALTLELAGQSCELALSDIDEAGLAQTAALAEALGGRVTTTRVDVSRREDVSAWAARVVEQHGKVNLVFNNAGVAHAGTVDATGYIDYEWVMAINFWGVVYGSKEFLPYLKEYGEGHIVNVSSVFGLFAQPMVSAYNASKFAVRGFTESLRQELDMEDCGVSASCVHPGGIKTNIARSARADASVSHMTGKPGDSIVPTFEKLFNTTAEQAARTILRGVQADKRRILIGPDAHLADAMQRGAPAGYQALVTTAMRFARSR